MKIINNVENKINNKEIYIKKKKKKMAIIIVAIIFLYIFMEFLFLSSILEMQDMQNFKDMKNIKSLSKEEISKILNFKNLRKENLNIYLKEVGPKKKPLIGFKALKKHIIVIEKIKSNSNNNSKKKLVNKFFINIDEDIKNVKFNNLNDFNNLNNLNYYVLKERNSDKVRTRLEIYIQNLDFKYVLEENKNIQKIELNGNLDFVGLGNFGIIQAIRNKNSTIFSYFTNERVNKNLNKNLNKKAKIKIKELDNKRVYFVKEIKKQNLIYIFSNFEEYTIKQDSYSIIDVLDMNTNRIVKSIRMTSDFLFNNNSFLFNKKQEPIILDKNLILIEGKKLELEQKNENIDLKNEKKMKNNMIRIVNLNKTYVDNSKDYFFNNEYIMDKKIIDKKILVLTNKNKYVFDMNLQVLGIQKY